MDIEKTKQIASQRTKNNIKNAAVVFCFYLILTLPGSIFSEILTNEIDIFSIDPKIILLLVAVSLVTALISNIYNVGFYRFTLLNSNTRPRWQEAFTLFKENVINIFSVIFITGLLISLWTLLFIIPGIIKMYQWFFVPIILAENPEMTGSEARKISTKMTEGIKLDIAIAQISFFGWFILMIFTLLISGFYSMPYMYQTFTQIYLDRKNKLNIVTVPENERIETEDKTTKEIEEDTSNNN